MKHCSGETGWSHCTGRGQDRGMRKFQARAVKVEMKRMGQLDSAQLTLTVELASVQREDKWSMVLDVTRVVKHGEICFFPLGKSVDWRKGVTGARKRFFTLDILTPKGFLKHVVLKFRKESSRTQEPSSCLKPIKWMKKKKKEIAGASVYGKWN